MLSAGEVAKVMRKDAVPFSELPNDVRLHFAAAGQDVIHRNDVADRNGYLRCDARTADFTREYFLYIESMFIISGLIGQRRSRFCATQARDANLTTLDEVDNLYMYYTRDRVSASGSFLRSINASEVVKFWRAQPPSDDRSSDQQVLPQGLEKLYLAGNAGALAVLAEEARWNVQAVMALDDLASQGHVRAVAAMKNLPADGLIARARFYKQSTGKRDTGSDTMDQYYTGRAMHVLFHHGNEAVVKAVTAGEVISYEAPNWNFNGVI